MNSEKPELVGLLPSLVIGLGTLNLPATCSNLAKSGASEPQLSRYSSEKVLEEVQFSVLKAPAAHSHAAEAL